MLFFKALELIAEFEEARRRADSERAAEAQSTVAIASMGHEEWKQACLRHALISNNKRTCGSTLSGIKKWVAFNRDALGDGNCGFPVTKQALLLWSCTFNTPGCFTNYLGYVKAACHLLGHDLDAFEEDALTRARVNITRSVNQGEAKTKRWIKHNLLLSAVYFAKENPEWLETAMWMVAGYAFLLRVPSECLPIVAGMGCGDNCELDVDSEYHAQMDRNEEAVTLKLQSRKNKTTPTEMKRTCWCKFCQVTCPVHALGEYLRSTPRGESVFPHVSDRSANRDMRKLLEAVGVIDAENYSTHDLRRGHTLDMAESGCSLAEILEAGGWCSKRFAVYINVETLESKAALAAKLDEFDDVADVD